MKTIGITQSETKFPLYLQWMKEEEVEIIILSYESQNLHDLEKCKGIILTGGIDTHPKIYNNSRLDYPLAPEKFSERRDIFEMQVFEFARKNDLPLLAICRGMQLMNCALGGDLIQDIEESGKDNHRKNVDQDRVHEITIEKESLLYQITASGKGKVNSAHHQALGKLAEVLMISAVSDDDIIEAVEYKKKDNKAFMLGVQWHPERLMIEESITPFSKNIREAFLKTIKKTT